MVKMLRNKKALELKRAELAPLLEREEELKKEAEELEQSIEGAEKEEDLDLIDEEIEKNTEEAKENEEKINSIKEEMKALEEEMEKLQEKTAKATTKKREVQPMLNVSEREQLRTLLSTEDSVERKFVSEVIGAIKEKRAFAGGEELIPETFIGILYDKTYKKSKLLPLVDVVNAKGTGKFLVDVSAPDFVWTEKCADIPELTMAALGTLELDRYALGGYVPVCNAIIEDAMIDVATYILDKMAEGKAKAIDAAILSGLGSDSNQPEGILTKVTNAAAAHDLEGIMAAAVEIGSNNDDDVEIDEVTLVMNPTDFYKYVKPATYQVDNNAKVVSMAPTDFKQLPDGTPVVLTKRIEAGTSLMGAFKSYKWRNAKNDTVQVLKELRALNRQTLFLLDGAHDGKVGNIDHFVKITLEKKPETPEA